MESLNIYESIAKRSQGDIYIGVVGPVRVGKSTFIRRFMDLLVIPNMKNVYAKERLLDEMPQSGSGRTITTTEPKFVPAEAVSLAMPGNINCRVRLVDCVGYLVPEALGYMEDGASRMVATPWDEEKIPFEEAAEKGTRKVIQEHSTVGIVITTDGTTSQIPRENYQEAEAKVIRQLKELQKPFVVVVNSTDPRGEKAVSLVAQLQEQHKAPVIAVDCAKMNSIQLNQIMESVLYQFPVSEVSFQLPGFMEGLETRHWIKASVMESIRSWARQFETAEDIQKNATELADGQIIEAADVEHMDLGTGNVVIRMTLKEDLFYKVIEELMDEPVENDYEFFRLLREFSSAKKAYDKVKGALEQVEATGYGIVQPKLTEMQLEKPEVFRQGSKCGVRLTATAPSLHIIRTDITTEVAPVVGTQQQSEDLVKHLLAQFETEPEKIWETNIFGKTLYAMAAEQMQSKLAGVPEHIRVKVQKSLQKICDEGKEYFICVII